MTKENAIRRPTEARSNGARTTLSARMEAAALADKAVRAPDAIKDQGNGLPSDWKLASVGDVGDVRYGLGQPPEKAQDGIPMVRATNIKRGRIVADGLIRIKREAIPEARNPFLKHGDIVVVRSGAYTGDVAMVTSEWVGAVAGWNSRFAFKISMEWPERVLRSHIYLKCSSRCSPSPSLTESSRMKYAKRSTARTRNSHFTAASTPP